MKHMCSFLPPIYKPDSLSLTLPPGYTAENPAGVPRASWAVSLGHLGPQGFWHLPRVHQHAAVVPNTSALTSIGSRTKRPSRLVSSASTLGLEVGVLIHATARPYWQAGSTLELLLHLLGSLARWTGMGEEQYDANLDKCTSFRRTML